MKQLIVMDQLWHLVRNKTKVQNVSTLLTILMAMAVRGTIPRASPDGRGLWLS
jgi:hypothetical protein